MPMQVLKVKQDTSFGGFFTWDEDDAMGQYRLSGTSLLPTWTPLPMYWDRPDTKRPNIAHSWRGGFAIDKRAHTVLMDILTSCCELLPLQSTRDEPFHLINPLVISDCLDKEKTRYRPGFKSMIDRFEFAIDRLPDSPLFLLPNRPELLTISERCSSGSDFKRIVERAKLTGLCFSELWSHGS